MSWHFPHPELMQVPSLPPGFPRVLSQPLRQKTQTRSPTTPNAPFKPSTTELKTPRQRKAYNAALHCLPQPVSGEYTVRGIETYNGIIPLLKKLVFKAPSWPFVYRWSRIRDTLKWQQREDQVTAERTGILFDIIENQLQEIMTEIDSLLQLNVMMYLLLWALFEPGTLVVSSISGNERFFIVDKCEYVFAIDVYFIDCNGKRFFYDTGCLAIYAYDGTKPITELNVVPATFNPAS
ncbi:hypothetical protein BDV06DRAFT_221902 [Aspergillus oleicola]